jgi:hypothetical protein
METTSPANSFVGWDLWEFIKGRKRSLVTALGALLGYWVTDNALSALISGMVIEGVFAVIDFYLTNVKLRK